MNRYCHVCLSSRTLVEKHQMQNLLGKGEIVLWVAGEDGYLFICVSVDAVSIKIRLHSIQKRGYSEH
jgi:hypothetical protein